MVVGRKGKQQKTNTESSVTCNTLANMLGARIFPTDCDILLSGDGSVSRRHATLCVSEGNVRLEQLVLTPLFI